MLGIRKRIESLEKQTEGQENGYSAIDGIKPFPIR